MKESKKARTIKLIQGDTLTAIFTIEDTMLENIKAATFVCKSLGIEVELIPANSAKEDSFDFSSDSIEDYNDNGIPDSRWYLWYPGDTNELRPGTFDYDVAIYCDEEVYTMIYHGKLVVQPKDARGYYQYGDYPHNTKREH